MASPTYGPNVADVLAMTLHLSSFTVADTTALLKRLAPQKMLITAFHGVARAKTGTHVTSNFILKNGSDTVATISLAGTAGTRVDGTINTLYERVAKGAEITIDVDENGGTTPALQDVDLVIEYVTLY